MNAEQIRALDAKLASQIGDDVGAIYDHESLFKQAREALQVALTAMAENDALQAAPTAEQLRGWATCVGRKIYAEATAAEIRAAADRVEGK